jgi:dTDP-4-dehydrorhamnose 3,5-epimerase (EC 5.1.3.13)
MQATRLAIPDVVLIEPKVFGDARGFFYESFNQRAFNQATGTDYQFVQDNHSRSSKGVLRGLHYQIHQPKASSCAWCRAPCSTWRWTSAKARPPSANGWAQN